LYIISNQSKNGKNGENEKKRIAFAKDCFFHFYDYQNLSEEGKDLKLKHYKAFVLTTEIEWFMSFFKTEVNIFKFSDK
jgi:hypothetical protein